MALLEVASPRAAEPKTRTPGGYSIVTADDLQSALSMANSCPAVTRGGGVEVGVLASLPEEHPAEQIRSELAGA